MTIKKQNKNDSDLWRSFTLYGFLSLNVGFMIVGGYFLGRLIEQKFHLKNMTITGILVGLFLGLFEMFTIGFKAGSKK